MTCYAFVFCVMRIVCHGLNKLAHPPTSSGSLGLLMIQDTLAGVCPTRCYNRGLLHGAAWVGASSSVRGPIEDCEACILLFDYSSMSITIRRLLVAHQRIAIVTCHSFVVSRHKTRERRVGFQLMRVGAGWCRLVRVSRWVSALVRIAAGQLG